MSSRIHPTAVVHPQAELADDVEVGPYCVIGAGVTIGPGSVLHNHVTVQGPTRLGARNAVYPYAVLGAEPQDLKFRGEATELVIGDGNTIREHTTIHRGTESGGRRTVIGNSCLIMVGCHIAHDCVIEDQTVLANGTMLGGHCLVEFGAVIGGGVGVHHFTTISTLSFVAGMARVSRDVPPYIVVEGAPATPRKINSTGLVRRGWSPEAIEHLRACFRLLFRAPGASMRQKIDALRRQPGQHAPVMRLCDFLDRVEVGVHGRHRESHRR